MLLNRKICYRIRNKEAHLGHALNRIFKLWNERTQWEIIELFGGDKLVAKEN